MMGDYHVRFCERLGVKFPLPTRFRAVSPNWRRQDSDITLKIEIL